MKILVLADFDEYFWQEGDCHADVCVGCGDVYETVISRAAQECGCIPALAVKGNHDSIFPFPDGVEDLHMRIIESAGLRFGGFNGCLRYKPRGPFLHSQAETALLLEGMAPVDVLVCHNSPWGVHDRGDDAHVGFQGIKDYIDRCNPKLVIHGHMHENCETTIGETRVLGVSGYRVVEV